jgi:hypothetical protein
MQDRHVPSWWQAFKDFYLVYLPLRFNIILVALIAYVFLLNAQGHDIIARLVGQEDRGAAIVFDCFVLLLALQLWFWSRQLLYLIPRTPPASRFPFWTKWIPRLLGILVFVIAFLALLRVGSEPTPARTAYILVLAIYFVLFILFVIVRRKMLKTPADESTPEVRLLSTQAKWIFIVTAALYVAFFALSFNIWTMVHLTSPVIVLLVTAIWVSVGVVIIYLGHRWGMPLFTFLIVFALLISPLADNHELVTTPAPANYTRQDPVAAFNAWVAARPAGQPVFFVMTEGGGIRAAYWTAAVLGALHRETGGTFTDHTFAISGISGGSVGAAVYEVAVATHAPDAQAAGKAALQYDALAPTLASFLVPDLLQRFIPAPIIRPDRARALEKGWEQGWEESHNPSPKAFAGGFLDLYAKNPNLPSLLMNGTVVETGQRSVTSNLRIPWGDALDTFAQTGTDLPVSTAALTSARFPIISPAGTMIKSATAPSRSPDCKAGAKCGHLVDGGYFESSGAATLIELMTMLKSSPASKDNYKKIEPYIYIILIQYENPKPVTSATFALETTAPLRALGSTLGARPVFAVNRLAELGKAVHFDLHAPKPPGPGLPLGWLLSEKSMSWMDQSINQGLNQQCVRTIADMLKGVIPPPGSCAAPPPPPPVAPLETPQEK